MDLEFETQVRQAAFEFLERKRSIYGEVFPVDALAEVSSSGMSASRW